MFNSFAEQKNEDASGEEQIEVQDSEEEEYEYVRVYTKSELKERRKNTEKLARQIVKEKFEKIDRQWRIQKEVERLEKLEQIKNGRDVSSDFGFFEGDELKKETRKERKLREKLERELEEQEMYEHDEEYEYDEEHSEVYDGGTEEKPEGEKKSKDEKKTEEFHQEKEFHQEIIIGADIDSAFLFRRITELELETWVRRGLRDARRGIDGNRRLKIKVPNCYYLNSVIYKRNDFEFTYQLDFFIYYFKQRYDHGRKFYDLGDPYREVAKQVMNLAGNTRYRYTDFNQIVDSIGVLLGYSVEEHLNNVISELNLEYLATGEIKIKHKNKNQTRIYANVKPSNIDRRSLGHIYFYTPKMQVIEWIDASPYNPYLPYHDNIDSLLGRGSYNDHLLGIPNDNTTPDPALIENRLNQHGAPTPDMEETKKEVTGENTQETDVTLQSATEKQLIPDIKNAEKTLDENLYKDDDLQGENTE